MKVKELIEDLKKVNQEAVVIVTSENFELNGAQVPANSVTEYTEGSIQNRVFQDAFDGSSYSVDTYSIGGGDKPIITIS